MAEVLHHLAVSLERLDQAKEIITLAFEAELPMLTLMLPSKDLEGLISFLDSLLKWEEIRKYRSRISVLGKWYELSEKVVEKIKALINETKDFDVHFLNLCINYDGQDELVDACKLISLQVKLGKLGPEGINKSVIKENLYTSGILPPNTIIIPKNRLNGFLLWDSANSRITIGEPKKEIEKLLKKELKSLRKSAEAK